MCRPYSRRAFGPFWAVESLELVTDKDTGVYHTWLCFAFNAALFVVTLALLPGVDFSKINADDDDGEMGEDFDGQGSDYRVSETTPILQNTPSTRKEKYSTPRTGRTPKLGERRNSLRPALVAQINQEFPSSDNLAFYTPGK